MDRRKEGRKWVNGWKDRRDDGEWVDGGKKVQEMGGWRERQVMGKVMGKQADGRDIG